MQTFGNIYRFYLMNFLKNTLRLLLSIVLVIAPIYIIFYFSNQTGIQSHGLSDKIATHIAFKWNVIFSLHLPTDSLKVLIDALSMPTRKLAHVTEYAILGGFAYSSMYILQRRVKISGIFLIMLLVILVASSDEIHQAFVAQRGSHVTDVIIDVTSGVMGIYLFIIFKDFCRKFFYLLKKMFKTVLFL